ncbi:MAG TPA: MFS transporter [Burkholderiales bacterium]|nr:MFS transporter [Burkholderiales bacterium]
MSIGTLLLIVLCNMSSFRASKVLITLFGIELGASQLTIGVMIALYSLFPALLALYAGKLSDRLGVRLPMLFGSLGMVAALLLPSLFPSMPALYASAALIGVTHMAYNVSAQNLIGSLGGAEARTRNFANYALAMALGSFIGPMAAGISIDYVGHAMGYLCIAALPLVPAAIMVSVRTVGRGPRVKTEDEQAVLSTSLLANPVLRRTLIASAVAVTAQDLFQFYMPIYGHSVGLSASAIGVVLAMSGIAAFLVRIWLPTLVKRWGPDTVFNGSLFIAAATFVLFPLFTSAPALAAIALVLGLGMGCAQPVTLMLIFNRAPEGRSGEALGMRVTINQVTHIAVPLLFGTIGSVFGLAPVFFTNALILAGGGLLNREKTRPQAGASNHR